VEGDAGLERLWAYVTPETTVYAIQPGRGFLEAARILGPNFNGILICDGWAPYRRFEHAIHQHLSRASVASLPHREIRAADSQVLVSAVRTGQQVADGSLFQARMGVILLGVFELLALGSPVLAYTGSWRTPSTSAGEKSACEWHWARAGRE
jgi:hypothetical protein